MTASSRAPRTCGSTGLRLVPVLSQSIYRIAKPSYGPLNPPLRKENPSDVGDWGRWDVLGGRTIYAVDTPEIAYREVLAYVTPSDGVRDTKLSSVFEDSMAQDDPRTLLAAITQEWEVVCRFEPLKIPRAWRDQRQLYVLAAPQTGWMVDIEHQDSLDALNRGLAQMLAKAGLSRLTRGHLLGEERRLTVLAASWVHDRVLDDGSLPHGINFSSKHGSNGACWAIWLRRVDDGHEATKEPTKHVSTWQIKAPDQNPALKAAAEAFGLTVY